MSSFPQVFPFCFCPRLRCSPHLTQAQRRQEIARMTPHTSSPSKGATTQTCSRLNYGWRVHLKCPLSPFELLLPLTTYFSKHPCFLPLDLAPPLVFFSCQFFEDHQVFPPPLPLLPFVRPVRHRSLFFIQCRCESSAPVRTAPLFLSCGPAAELSPSSPRLTRLPFPGDTTSR